MFDLGEEENRCDNFETFHSRDTLSSESKILTRVISMEKIVSVTVKPNYQRHRVVKSQLELHYELREAR